MDDENKEAARAVRHQATLADRSAGGGGVLGAAAVEGGGAEGGEKTEEEEEGEENDTDTTSLDATSLLPHLFNTCLFAQPSTTPTTVAESRKPSPPRCKTRASRAAAYRLLGSLCGGHTGNTTALMDLGLYSLMDRVPHVTEWEYSPSDAVRSVTGFSGLHNLQNICYLNSVVQQLYHVPEVREGLLAVEDRSDDKTESLLFQTQLMFSFLNITQRQAFTPRGFCHAFKDSQGKPIDPSVQQDANEFLNSFVERLESSLKGTPQEKLMNTLQGTVVNQLIHKNKMRERTEPFAGLTVEVKNTASLEESLKKMIEGEVISDFKWQEEDKEGVNVKKRPCIGEMPQTIMVAPNRFVFNFETFVQVHAEENRERGAHAVCGVWCVVYGVCGVWCVVLHANTIATLLLPLSSSSTFSSRRNSTIDSSSRV